MENRRLVGSPAYEGPTEYMAVFFVPARTTSPISTANRAARSTRSLLMPKSRRRSRARAGQGTSATVSASACAAESVVVRTNAPVLASGGAGTQPLRLPSTCANARGSRRPRHRNHVLVGCSTVGATRGSSAASASIDWARASATRRRAYARAASRRRSSSVVGVGMARHCDRSGRVRHRPRAPRSHTPAARP